MLLDSLRDGYSVKKIKNFGEADSISKFLLDPFIVDETKYLLYQLSSYHYGTKFVLLLLPLIE